MGFLCLRHLVSKRGTRSLRITAFLKFLPIIINVSCDLCYNKIKESSTCCWAHLSLLGEEVIL